MEENLGIQLSIIVPVYNVEKYVRPCMESIFRQGLDEDCFEVIIVNDGTNDHSMEVIQDLIEQHKNIIIINQENQGLSVARNVGMATAKGQYILMIDSDDLLIENSLKPLLELALESQTDVVIADFFEMTNAEINSTIIDLPNFADIKIEKKTGEQMFFDFLRIHNYTVWRSLYRNEFLRKHKITFYPGIYCQDKPFTHEIYLKAKTCIRASWPIYIYRRHPQGISYAMSEKLAKDCCKVIEIMWDMASNMDLSPKIREKMFDHTFNAFTVLSNRLIHDYKSINKSAEIIHYLNSIAPHLNFKHGIKQKIYTLLFKKSPLTYICLRYIYSYIWEDRINPFLRHQTILK
jgi:glycosyltransferase involved in cell wall biosynthesis